MKRLHERDRERQKEGKPFQVKFTAKQQLGIVWDESEVGSVISVSRESPAARSGVARGDKLIRLQTHSGQRSLDVHMSEGTCQRMKNNTN